MIASTHMQNSRYLLFIDVLGFSELVESKGTEEIYEIINEALQAFAKWEELNQLFKTLYFSDTFIFYQEPKGYGDWAFLDVYAIGAMVLSALLAKGIPARGAISFGEFEVILDRSENHQVYFGRALIEAYKAEQKENWIGITVLPSAWAPYEAANPGVIDVFSSEGVWIRREDGVLFLNPLIKLRSWYLSSLVGEVEKPYREWDAPEFPNDILAFRFLRNQAKAFSDKGDFTSKVAMKYHSTIEFLHKVLGPEIYAWGIHLSDELDA